MDTTAPDPSSTDAAELFDEVGGSVVCRVCGSLVAPDATYRQAHWDWHEAASGA